MSTMDVHQHWTQACSTLNIPQSYIDEFWDVIKIKYGESQRFYHTMDHIEDLFNHFNSVKERLHQPTLVTLAIIFHDVIYEPKEKDNEEKSSELFQSFIQSAANGREGSTDLQKEQKVVVEWILATKSHETEVNTTPDMYGDSDLHYFLDMDMAILGVPSQDYKVYAEKIRKEYIHYSEDAYRQGRAKVLKSFLNIPNIYATKFFRQRLESQARSNIQDEIRCLLKEDN